MKIAFLVWLIATILMNVNISYRWSSVGLLNRSIKGTFFLIALGGAILIYHRFVLNNPL